MSSSEPANALELAKHILSMTTSCVLITGNAAGAAGPSAGIRTPRGAMQKWTRPSPDGVVGETQLGICNSKGTSREQT